MFSGPCFCFLSGSSIFAIDGIEDLSGVVPVFFFLFVFLLLSDLFNFSCVVSKLMSDFELTDFVVPGRTRLKYFFFFFLELVRIVLELDLDSDSGVLSLV